jgi:hypothetical protein
MDNSKGDLGEKIISELERLNFQIDKILKNKLEDKRNAKEC